MKINEKETELVLSIALDGFTRLSYSEEKRRECQLLYIKLSKSLKDSKQGKEEMEKRINELIIQSQS